MKTVKMLVAVGLVLGFVGSLQAAPMYQEDFNEWRDEASNPGFNANFKLDADGKTGVITTNKENTFGKVMSSEGGITLEINENTELSYELFTDIPKGDIKVNLMTAGDPYDSHEIVGAKAKKGVYKAKIAEKTPWTGTHTFWIEMWLEGSDRTAKVGNIKIYDASLPAEDNEVTKQIKQSVSGKKKTRK